MKSAQKLTTNLNRFQHLLCSKLIVRVQKTGCLKCHIRLYNPRLILLTAVGFGDMKGIRFIKKSVLTIPKSEFDQT